MTIQTTETFANNGSAVVTAEWVATVSADNAASTVTRAAVANKAHYVSTVAASFSGAATQLLTIKSGVTVVFRAYVHNATVITFPAPLKVEGALEVTLAASGTLGVLGAVNAVGFTA